MKPIWLRMQAFGPYAGTAKVDFLRLSEVGLFVVSGPTGAGKTSIFDAMAYALFGDLPGERSGFNELRSDHAALDLLCEVEFHFDAAGSRWRVNRVPTQERAKKRGTGTAKESAKASLDRFDNGEWVAVSSSVRDVSERCSDLIGLNADQFQRVVLLPQGQFQQVLKAKSAERRELLRTLFSSSLYSKIELRLKERASAAESVLDDLGRQQGSDHEVARTALFDAAKVLEADEPQFDLDSTLETLDSLAVELSDTILSGKRKLLASSVAAVQAAATAREKAEAQVRSLDRLEMLSTRQVFLAGQADQHAATRHRVKQAERARPLAKSVESVNAHANQASEARDVALRLTQQLVAQGEVAGIAATGIVVGEVPSREVIADARSQAGVVAEATRQATERLVNAKKAQDAAKAAEAACAKESDILASLEKRRSDLDQQQVARRASVASLATTAAGIEQKVSDHVVATERLTLARRLGALVSKTAEIETNAAAQEAIHETTLTRLVALEPAIEAFRERANALDARTQRAAELRSVRERRDRLIEAHLEVAELRTQSLDASERATATLRRFERAASPRLAESLVDGEPCAVCGSVTHPAPATADSTDSERADLAAVEQTNALASDLVRQLGEATATADALIEALGEHVAIEIDELSAQTTAAEASIADAELAVRQLAESQAEQVDLRAQSERVSAAIIGINDELRAVQSERAHVEGALGAAASLPIEDLSQQVAAADALVAEARASVEQIDIVNAELQQAEAALSQCAADIVRSQQAAARHEQTRDLETARAEEILAGIDGSLDHYTARGLLMAEFLGAVERLSDAQLAVAQHEARRDALSVALNEQLGESDFASIEVALESVLEPAHQKQLQATFDDWETKSAEVAAAIKEVRQADLPDEAPDVAALATVEKAAAADEQHLRAQVTAADLHLAQATERLARIRTLEAEVAETRAAAQRVKELADVCAGNGPTRRSLESWVLAAHLRDVVELANKHLAPMSSGRYELVVADAPDDRRREAGLDLTVLDARSGKARPVASLSGGETFQASLALALGLADVVSANRGGVQIDALFVDEGFGSLDAESLDHAIDVLDGLRSRGSLVGVITHVEAMKQALQVGIVVERDPTGNGSRLTQLV